MKSAVSSESGVAFASSAATARQASRRAAIPAIDAKRFDGSFSSARSSTSSTSGHGGLDAGEPFQNEIRPPLERAVIEKARADRAVDPAQDVRFVAEEGALEFELLAGDLQRGGRVAPAQPIDLAVLHQADAADDLP